MKHKETLSYDVIEERHRFMTIFEIMSLSVSVMALLSTIIMVGMQLLVYYQEWNPILLCENIEIEKQNSVRDAFSFNIRLQNVGQVALKYDICDYSLLLNYDRQEDLVAPHSKKMIGPGRYMYYKAKHTIIGVDNAVLRLNFKIKYSKVHSKKTFITKVKAEFEGFPQNPKMTLLESYIE